MTTNITPLKVPVEIKDKVSDQAYNFINDLAFSVFQLNNSFTTSVTFGFNSYLIDYVPSTETTVTGGIVIQYSKDGDIVYRFVPEPYVYSQDAFYRNFDGSSVSDLIVSR